MQHKHHILIVDDHDEILDLFAQVLETPNRVVHIAYNGIEAIEKLKSNPIDLVITDYEMEKMTGPELINWIRDYYKKIPVILQSGNHSALVQAEPFEADYIVEKPGLKKIKEIINEKFPDSGEVA